MHSKNSAILLSCHIYQIPKTLSCIAQNSAKFRCHVRSIKIQKSCHVQREFTHHRCHMRSIKFLEYCHVPVYRKSANLLSCQIFQSTHLSCIAKISHLVSCLSYQIPTNVSCIAKLQPFRHQVRSKILKK